LKMRDAQSPRRKGERPRATTQQKSRSAYLSVYSSLARLWRRRAHWQRRRTSSGLNVSGGIPEAIGVSFVPRIARRILKRYSMIVGFCPPILSIRPDPVSAAVEAKRFVLCDFSGRNIE